MGITAKTDMRALEQRLNSADAGLSHLQYGILRALSCQEQTISELSDHFMLDPSTLVPAVDALERKGLLQRGHDPNDRRRIPLSPTDYGTAFVARVPFVDKDDPLVTSLHALGDEWSRQFLAMLRELVKNLPEGEEILQRVSTRMQAHMEGDTTAEAT
jgi:DNA-binding MarR family transcriptional regulator